MKMGHEPEHSLMVTIPRKICKTLQIDKGAKLYFKLEGNKFVVSKDDKFLENTDGNHDDVITVESMESAKEKEDVIAGGIYLADLQY